MPRLRPDRRIQPARVPVSRRRVAGLTALGLVVGAWLLATVADRSASRSLALDGAAAYRISSSAGPLEIGAGPEARLDYRASWLVRGPTVVAGPEPGPDSRIEIEVSCATRWPCRASAELVLGADPLAGEEPIEVDAVTSDGPIVIGGLAGHLAATTTGADEVVLGAVSGSVRVTTERGDVSGAGLAADDVEVWTDGGAVDLSFQRRPRSVVVVAGTEPVELELPPGRYAVSVVGSPSATIDVPRDDSADSRITIDGRGPVRITSTT